MEQIKKYMIPIMIAALLLSGCAGFALGRATTPKASVATTETTESVDPNAANAAATEETVEKAMEAATEAVTEAAQVADNEKIIDAADVTDINAIPHTDHVQEHNFDMDAAGGQADDGEVDPEKLANVTTEEAVLPDGVASTLWSKEGDEAMQIVVFGDSQFGNFLGKDGMAYKLSQKAQANVYNMAIGGTSAAIRPGYASDNDNLENQNLICWIKTLEGWVNINRYDNYVYQQNVYKSCDFSKTDVFILEYGANDYYQKTPLISDDSHDLYTYSGALRYAINFLRTTYPQASIIVCSPTFANFFESGTGAYLGNYYSLSNGYGKLIEYADAAYNAPGDYQKTINFNPQYEVKEPIDLYNARDMLLDGIHMTEKMRDIYTDALAVKCIKLAGYEIDGVDNLYGDWRSTKKTEE